MNPAIQASAAGQRRLSDGELAICIVNWNTGDLLIDCLNHLRVTEPAERSIWVFDNGSTDDSVGRLRAVYPDVAVVESPRNLGFAAGVNQLLSVCGGTCALLLNTDARPEPGAIGLLKQYFAGHPRVGAVGPRLTDAQGRHIACHDRFPTVTRELAKMLGIRRFSPHSDTRDDVDWVEGAALMLSRAAVNDVGLFDPSYFMYCEEVDWCFRARTRGWRIACLPSARVVHFVGRSGNVRRRAQLYGSKILYQQRYGGRGRATVMASAFMGAQLLRWTMCAALRGARSGDAHSHAYALRACWQKLRESAG